MWLVAAETTPATDGQTQIILAVIGLLSLVLVSAVGGLFSLLTARANRTSTAQPPPAQQEHPDFQFRDYVVGELAVNRQRDDDNDERDDWQDRRHENSERRHDDSDRRFRRIERHLELPEWPG